MRFRIGIFRAALIASSILPAACSPYVFSDDVQNFSKSLGSIETSYKDTAKAIVAEEHLRNRLQWSRDHKALQAGPGCHIGATGPAVCDLMPADKTPPLPVAVVSRAEKPPEDICAAKPTPAGKPAIAKSLEPVERAAVLRALDNYAAGLAAITKAQDRADFDSAAAKVSAAIGDLAKSAGPEAAAAGPVAKASVNLLLWAVGQDLDYRRLRQLHAATEGACEPIRLLSGALGVALEQERDAYLTALRDVLVLKVQAVNRLRGNRGISDQTYGAAIDDAYAAADAFQKVRVSDPWATAQTLRKAHDELVVAVRTDDGQLAALVASIQAFTDRASELATAAAAAGKKS